MEVRREQGAVRGGKGKDVLDYLPFIGRKAQLPPGLIAQFSRQLGVMIRAGMPLIDALEAIRDEADDERLHAALSAVVADVESGSRLSEAMKRQSATFSDLFVNMIEAGETSGSLELILLQMADFFKRRHKLQRTIKSALAYPKIVIFIFVMMLLGIFGFLVPRFVEIFEQFDTPLPALTQVLVLGSDLVIDYVFITVPVVVGLLVGIKAWAGTKEGRKILDALDLELPLFGILIKKANASRFAMTLSVLIRNGVNLDQSMEITTNTMNNVVLKESMNGVRNAVIEGESLYQAMQASDVFPSLMARMIRVGEESGALPDMLMEVTSYYEDEVDAVVERLTVLVEPVLIVMLGGVAAVVLLGIYMPIFNLASAATGF